MVKKLTRKALGLLVFAAVLLMPFAVTAAIPAKPALNGNLIAGDPVIPSTAVLAASGDPVYTYDAASGSLTTPGAIGNESNHYCVDYPLDASLTADSSYVISVDISIIGRADTWSGPAFLYRQKADGTYWGLWFQGDAVYNGTFTKAADGTLSFSANGGTFGGGCLPTGAQTLKIYVTPSRVTFSVYDADGKAQDLYYVQGGVTYPLGSTEYGFNVAEGTPVLGVAVKKTQLVLSNLMVYSPTVNVEGNLATGAPTIPAAATAYSYDSAAGILSVQGQPPSKYMVDYPLSAELTAKDSYTIAFDYDTLSRYNDPYVGPMVMYRKTTDGKYLGFWFQNSAFYNGVFTLGADGQLTNVSLGSMLDPLVDGKGGSMVIESTPTSVSLSLYDDQGNVVPLKYSANGEEHVFYGPFVYEDLDPYNGVTAGDPAFGVTMYGTNTTIKNLVVSSDTIDDNTVEVETPDNGNVAINGDVNVNDVEAGSTVTLTVTPAQGYQIKAGSLAYVVDGKTYPITTRVGEVDGAGNTFAFAMPEGNVSITAEFIDAGADNMATLGASYKDNDLRFVNRVYRTNARGELKNCGNYLLRADSALGEDFADGAALTEQQKADLLAAVAAGTAFKVPTTVLNDRCEDYIDFAVRINGAGQDAYKDKAYVCVSYATFDNGDTIYGNACVRSFDGVKNAVSGQ